MYIALTLCVITALVPFGDLPNCRTLRTPLTAKVVTTARETPIDWAEVDRRLSGLQETSMAYLRDIVLEETH